MKSPDEIKKGIAWDEVDKALQNVHLDSNDDADVQKPKTPEQIKKGLECCTIPLCAECPYDNEPSCVVKNADALALIQQLEDHLREATKKIEQLEAERDAVLEDKRGECTYCAYLPGDTIPQTCFDCANKGYYRWEWCGVQKEE